MQSSLGTPDVAADAKSPRIIDLRSDTVTKPSPEMRLAMLEADVGDDVFGDDPTMNLLEKEAASTLGKESALFVPSGTMGNLISVMLHCSRRGDAALVGDKSHINVFEQGGLASLGGVHTTTVRNLPDGTLDLEEITSKINPDDIHFPCTKLLCIENTHNLMGGRVLSLDYLNKVTELVKTYNLKLHIDGARMFNAATALGVPVAALVKHADSVTFCLSKALGAPVGSMVAGSTAFIDRARRLRQALGGGMRQAGVLAAPGLIALNKMSKRLEVDHKNARDLAAGLASMQHLGIEVDTGCVETNLVYFSVKHPHVSAHQLIERLEEASEDGLEVKMLVLEANLGLDTNMRAVVHHHISEQDIEDTIDKMRHILSLQSMITI